MIRWTRRSFIKTGVSLAAILSAKATRTLAATGEVNVYSSRHYPSDDLLFDTFTKQTGIAVNRIEGKAEELIERMKQEGDQSPCDVFITVDAGNLWRAEEKGLFQPVNSSELSHHIPEHLRHPDGLWFAFSKRARVMLYDKKRVAEGEIGTYEELATAPWKGRVLIRSSNNIYNQSLVASMIAHHGAEETETWAKGLVANMARAPKGGDIDQIKALIAGVGDIAISNTYYFARMVAEEKELHDALQSIAILFPNQKDRGTHVNVSGAGMAAHAPNRDNAQQLLEFLISTPAQEIFSAANYEYPVREGAALSPVIAAWGNFREDSLSLTELGKHNAEAVRIMDRAGWR